MTLFHLFPGNLSCCHSQTPRVSAANAGIPPVLYLFYQEARGGPVAASLLSRLR
jgi:hypothetical protein